MTTTLTKDQQLDLQTQARSLTTRCFDDEPFDGHTLHTDKALTLIARALTIIATIMAHTQQPSVGPPGALPG